MSFFFPLPIFTKPALTVWWNILMAYCLGVGAGNQASWFVWDSELFLAFLATRVCLTIPVFGHETYRLAMLSLLLRFGREAREVKSKFVELTPQPP